MISSVSGVRLDPVSSAAGSAKISGTQTGVSFEAMLKDLATGAVDTLQRGEAAATLGVRGGLPAQDVVQAVISAEQSLQTVIAVRDKVVAAYLELSRMSI